MSTRFMKLSATAGTTALLVCLGAATATSASAAAAPAAARSVASSAAGWTPATGAHTWGDCCVCGCSSDSFYSSDGVSVSLLGLLSINLGDQARELKIRQ